MTQTLALGPEWLQPDVLINDVIDWLGPWALVGLALIIFAECGLLLGFFLPGDSLLFTAGLFVVAYDKIAPLWLTCLVLVIAAFAGNVCGYWIGRAAGPPIFDRPRSRLFKPKHVERTQQFFDKYGNRAIVLGRFVPIVRTFITVMAGVGKMDAKRYFLYSAIGGVAWAAGVTLLGALLGQVEFVRNNIDLILVLIVLISVVPIAIEFLRARSQRQREPFAAGAERFAAERVDVEQPTERIDVEQVRARLNGGGSLSARASEADEERAGRHRSGGPAGPSSDQFTAGRSRPER